MDVPETPDLSDVALDSLAWIGASSSPAAMQGTAMAQTDRGVFLRIRRTPTDAVTFFDWPEWEQFVTAVIGGAVRLP